MMARLSLLFNVGYRVVGERFGVIHGSPVQHMASLLLLYTFPCVFFFLFIFNGLYLLISNI